MISRGDAEAAENAAMQLTGKGAFEAVGLACLRLFTTKCTKNTKEERDAGFGGLVGLFLQSRDGRWCGGRRDGWAG